MTYSLVLLVAVLFVAFANGANDGFKGVATLVGTQTTGYPSALGWAIATTFAGSITALVLSERLVKTFSGAGLVPQALVGTPTFVTAVALGAAATVLLATRLSFPISTTHALMGALIGAGWTMGGDVRLAGLGANFLLPLLLSPLVAVGLVAVVYPTLRWARIRLAVTRTSCVRVEGQWLPAAQLPSTELTLLPGGVLAREERYQGVVLSVDAQQILTFAHVLTAGAASFARGLNDTPKICALLIAASAMGFHKGLAMVGVVMAIGAALSGRRVANTLSHEITQMNHGQGFAANLITAALVIAASASGMPVSTTHVSCGALFGLGLVTRQANRGMIAGIVLSWIITLPVAILFSALAALALR